jgi:transposase
MRGADITQESLFTTATLANFVPDDHPLREIRALVDETLGRMKCLFSALYPETRRTSVAPEKLLRAQLLQLFYSILSERLLMEQLQYNLLFLWLLGIAIDKTLRGHSVFSKNRDRLNGSEVAAEFLREVVAMAQLYEYDGRESVGLFKHPHAFGAMRNRFFTQKRRYSSSGIPLWISGIKLPKIMLKRPCANGFALDIKFYSHNSTTKPNIV